MTSKVLEVAPASTGARPVAMTGRIPRRLSASVAPSNTKYRCGLAESIVLWVAVLCSAALLHSPLAAAAESQTPVSNGASEQGLATPEPASQTPLIERTAAPLPFERYEVAAADGARIYQLAAGESELLIKVTRAGMMARLGHDHAVAAQQLEGYVAVNPDRSSFADLAMPLGALAVDRPADRAQLRIKGTPSDDAIAGTLKNLYRVIDADAFPWAQAEVTLSDITATSTQLSLNLQLQGESAELQVPVELTINDQQLEVSGSFRTTHRAFGLKPFSAAGGLMRVADRLDVHFKFIAYRLQP